MGEKMGEARLLGKSPVGGAAFAAALLSLCFRVDQFSQFIIQCCGSAFA